MNKIRRMPARTLAIAAAATLVAAGLFAVAGGSRAARPRSR